MGKILFGSVIRSSIIVGKLKDNMERENISKYTHHQRDKESMISVYQTGKSFIETWEHILVYK